MWKWIVVGVCAVILVIYALGSVIGAQRQLKLIGGSWQNLENNSWKGTKEEFLRYYANSHQYKRPGVYIHKNLDNGKCYVGQSRDIFNRVKRELDGLADNAGCKALYEAYQNGYRFQIVLIFQKRGYPNLHKMERAFINLHEARTKGYNKTYGNDEDTGKTIYK